MLHSGERNVCGNTNFKNTKITLKKNKKKSLINRTPFPFDNYLSGYLEMQTVAWKYNRTKTTK